MNNKCNLLGDFNLDYGKLHYENYVHKNMFNSRPWWPSGLSHHVSNSSGDMSLIIMPKQHYLLGKWSYSFWDGTSFIRKHPVLHKTTPANQGSTPTQLHIHILNRSHSLSSPIIITHHTTTSTIKKTYHPKNKSNQYIARLHFLNRYCCS